MRLLPILLLLAAVGCAPEPPEAVARRQFTNLRHGYFGYAEKLLTPQMRWRENVHRMNRDNLHGKPPFMGEKVVDMLVGAATLQAAAFAFDVLEVRVEGDTARLVVRRQWPDARAIMQHQNAAFEAERDSLLAALKTRVRTPRNRHLFDQLRARQTAAIIASDPARYVRTDTVAYVLARQYNVWRIVDDGGLLTAPVGEAAAATADMDSRLSCADLRFAGMTENRSEQKPRLRHATHPRPRRPLPRRLRTRRRFRRFDGGGGAGPRLA